MRSRLRAALVLALLPFFAACSSSGSEVVPTFTPTNQLRAVETPVQPLEGVPSSSTSTDGQVEIKSSVNYQYYLVSGSNTLDIFEAIDRNGPSDDTSAKGSGLTAASWGYRWQPEMDGGFCVIASMTINLDMVVTLPRHENLEVLTPELAANWSNFVDGVKKHEDQHVKINLAGAETIRQGMEALEPADDCDVLEEEVDSLWNDQQEQIEAAQDRFHAQEDSRLATARAPIQQQIDENSTQLADYSDQIDKLDDKISVMDTELIKMESQLAVLQQQMDLILGNYAEGDLPPELSAQYEGVRLQYNLLAPQYNLLVDEYNRTISDRNGLADKHDQLIEETNDLVEAYNWTR